MKDTLTRRASGVITRSAKASGALAAVSLGELQPRKGGKNGSANHWKLRCKGKPHTWLYGTDNAVCSTCGYTMLKAMATNQPDQEGAAAPRQYPEWITYVWHQDHEHKQERHVLRDVVRNANVVELVAAEVPMYGGTTRPGYQWQLLQDPEVHGYVSHYACHFLSGAKGQAKTAFERWKREQARKSEATLKPKADPKRTAQALAEVEANRQALLAHNLKQVMLLGWEEVRKRQAKERLPK